MAQAADHMNAKVSPYLAFLTEMHSKIAAMEPPVVNKIQGWDRIPEGQNIYLDQNGKPMSTDDFDKETEQLLSTTSSSNTTSPPAKTTSKTRIL